MPEMKTLNGYEIVDAKARQDIATLKDKEVDDSYFLNFADAPNQSNPAPATARMIEFVKQLRAGKDVCAQIIDSHDNTYYPSIITTRYYQGLFTVYLTKVSGNINNLPANLAWEWDTVCIQYDGTDCVYYIAGSNSYEFVSKEYVDEAVKNAGGGGSADLTGYATEDYVNTAISDALGVIENGSY